MSDEDEPAWLTNLRNGLARETTRSPTTTTAAKQWHEMAWHEKAALWVANPARARTMRETTTMQNASNERAEKLALISAAHAEGRINGAQASLLAQRPIGFVREALALMPAPARLRVVQ